MKLSCRDILKCLAESIAINFVLIIAFMLIANTSFAQTVRLDDLTPENVAKVEKLIAEQKIAQAKTPAVSPESLDAYADVGTKIAKALASTAKELGVEVNNFAKTDVGQLAIFLIIWHFFGSVIVHLLAGGTLFWVGMFITYQLWKYAIKDSSSPQEGSYWLVSLSLVGTVIVSWVTIFTF